VPRIADRYQPRYQRALESVEAAEKASNVDGSAAERAKSAYASFVNVLSRANASSPSYEWSAYRIPAAAGFLLAAVILAVVRSRQFRTGDPERKYLTAAALAAVALAGFLVAAMAFGTENDRTDVAAELQQAAGLGIHPQPLGPAGRPIAATTVAPQSSAVGQGIASLESPGLAGGSVKRSNPATSGPPGAGSPLESAADGQPTVRMMLAANPSATAALASEFATRVRQRLAAAVPPGPAGDKVRDAVPKLPPLVVREYAHAGPNVTAANRNLFDATDTVLWQPVVVVPGTGTFTLNFSLSGSPAGYRILIAGHTPDGRIGSVRGTLPVGPAK
jgi:hypothetical protein